MPEGPFGFPRLTEIGPFVDKTEVEKLVRRIQRISPGGHDVNIQETEQGVSIQAPIFEQLRSSFETSVIVINPDTGLVSAAEVRTPFYILPDSADPESSDMKDLPLQKRELNIPSDAHFNEENKMNTKVSKVLNKVSHDTLHEVLGDDVRVVQPAPTGGFQKARGGVRLVLSASRSGSEIVSVARAHLTFAHVEPEVAGEIVATYVRNLKNSILEPHHKETMIFLRS